MGNTEIIIAVLIVVGIVGQVAVVAWGRRKTFFDPKHSAKKRAELIEREYDKNYGEKK